MSFYAHETVNSVVCMRVWILARRLTSSTLTTAQSIDPRRSRRRQTGKLRLREKACEPTDVRVLHNGGGLVDSAVVGMVLVARRTVQSHIRASWTLEVDDGGISEANTQRNDDGGLVKSFQTETDVLRRSQKF